MIPSADQQQVMTLDCTAYRRYSLVQNDEGTRAICTALKDILWFSDFVFPAAGNQHELVKMTVISVDLDQECCAECCRFSVEVRYHGYCRQEILKTIKKQIFSRFVVRADRMEVENAA
ncbi:zinc-binding metallopeptidase family protein [Pedobacter frigoris]|uniref:Uncharacterized protein n=1 Tax=Pedobacter frigoris TaxID=2571272 RepID=A0A4U1CLP0_9SPHI|nr:hypothetical protein [Pedobacter frigoris]TKC07231.1 hypothetical protein FA047_08225 [Pedobacter frigoris]